MAARSAPHVRRPPNKSKGHGKKSVGGTGKRKEPYHYKKGRGK